MDKFAYITIDTKGQVRFHEHESDTFDWRDLQKMCDGTFEIVHMATFKGVRDDLVMILDDNGKMLNKPINLVGTSLYGNPCDCIVGKIGICTTDTKRLDDEPDVYPLEYQDAKRLEVFLKGLSDKLMSWTKENPDKAPRKVSIRKEKNDEMK